MKTKKILSLTLSIIFIIVHTLSVFPVNALDNILEYKSVAMVYNDSVLYINVAIDSEENIYMTADDISKYTPFTYYSDSESFIYDKQDVNNLITKEIQIDIDNKMLYIYNNWINVIPTIIPQQLSGVYQQEDNLYLPIAEIFPCLDTCIDVSDEKLIVIPSTSTLSNTLCNINVNDYLFDMYYSETKIAEFICTLYEDLSNLRISRLPIIRSAFNYTETQHFKDVFTDYLLDNSVYYEAINEVISSKETIAKSLIDNLEKYKDEADYAKFSYIPSWLATTVIDVNAMDKSEEWGFDKKVSGTLGAIEKTSDGFYDLVSTYTAYQFHIADHICMLNSVYDLENQSHKYSLFMNENETEAYAARIVYDKYSSELVDALFNAAAETIGENIIDKLKDLSTQKISELLNVHLNSYLIEIEKTTINKVFPSFTTTAENFEILPYHYKITNTALSKYNMNRIILVDESYGERINNTRLNLLLYLTSSKYCYKAIQNSAKANKNDSLNNICTNNINQIDELLASLYLAAFSIEQDSYENLDTIIETNRQAIKNISLSEPTNAFELYKKYFVENYELSDLVCLADVTHDGVDEMIVITKKEDGVKIYNGLVFSIVNNEIVKIYEKEGTDNHVGGFFNWYLTCNEGVWNLAEEYFHMWQGMGETGFKEYYLNNNGDVIENKLIFAPQSSNDLDNNGIILDNVFDDYVKKLTTIINNSYRIFYCFSEAWEAEPQKIETNPAKIFGIEKNKSVSIDEISSLSDIQLNIPAIVIANGGLNLRSGPSINNSAITLIPKKARINVISVTDNFQDSLNGKWVYVDYNGQKGYVNSNYLCFETKYEIDSLSSEQIFILGMVLYQRYLSDTTVLSLPSLLEKDYDIEVLVDENYKYNGELYRKLLPKGMKISDIESAYSEEFSRKYHTPSYSQYLIEYDGYVWEPWGFGGDVEFNYAELIKLNKITETEIYYTIREHCNNGETQIEVEVDFSIVFEDNMWKCGKITGHA